MTRVVPFPRVLRAGITGRDVTAVQRALEAAKCTVGHPKPRTYDVSTARSVNRFQQRNRLHVDGVYGLATHAKLAPLFDDYGAWLMGLREGPTVSLEDQRRASAVAAMTLLLNHAGAVHYRQARPMRSVLDGVRPPHYPTSLDCSESVTWAMFTAGAPDPNCLGFNGAGYTGTLIRNGHLVSVLDAKPGDLVLYGDPFGSTGHVAMLATPGRVISQGSEGGPYLLAYNYRPVTGIRAYPWAD